MGWNFWIPKVMGWTMCGVAGLLTVLASPYIVAIAILLFGMIGMSLALFPMED